MTDQPQGKGQFCGRTRREFLWESGAGFASLALGGLLGNGFFAGQSLAADGLTQFKSPLTPLPAMLAARAKSVIFLFMYGGPSHMDTFDYKPALYPLDGKTIDVTTFGRGGHRKQGRVVGPKWNFKQYGECGKYVSDLFPNVGSMVDDITFLHSMTADSPLHGSAMLMMNSGKLLSGAPCLGSWVNYGLGTLNENLPGFVVMLDQTGGPISGAKNWSSGYMPGQYQGTVLRSEDPPILDLQPPPALGGGIQRSVLDHLRAENAEHAIERLGNPDLSARIASYELAYQMQSSAPEAVDLAKEDEETHSLYGIDQAKTQDFGKKCLMARRLVERGVRFVQIYSGGNHNDNNWDAHGDLKLNHDKHTGATDLPIAGLLKDLKRRGMLDETLVIWGGEFGRQPTAEYSEGTGRDHNAYGFTMWMAGGGTKGGTSIGQTDELGSAAVESPLQVKNLHATALHLMGLDPNRLTYFHAGLDRKLVGFEDEQPIWNAIS